MTRLEIGGVPEHFNLPWHDLIASGALAREGIEAAWTDYPSGTGAMVADLDRGALDLAVLLTEGAAAGVANGGTFSILSLYTASPLIWGVHTPGDSSPTDIDELAGRRFAISREGSGSHLMVFALARQRQWPLDGLRFVPVGGLDGALRAFAAGDADAFLWEKFMTSPLVAAGRFQRVGDFAAPWPAFVVCASQGALEADGAALGRTIELVLEHAAALKRAPDTPARIAERYELESRAVADWLEGTAWAARPGIRASDVEPAVELLRACGVVPAQARVPVASDG